VVVAPTATALMTSTGAPVEERIWTSGTTSAPTDDNAIRSQPVAEEPFERVSDAKHSNIENVVDKDGAKAKAMEEGHSGRSELERSTSSWTSSSAESNGSDSQKSIVQEKQTWSEKLNPLKRKHKPPIPRERGVCPEYNANFWSLLTFQWMAPLMHVSNVDVVCAAPKLTSRRSVTNEHWKSTISGL